MRRALRILFVSMLLFSLYAELGLCAGSGYWPTAPGSTWEYIAAGPSHNGTTTVEIMPDGSFATSNNWQELSQQILTTHAFQGEAVFMTVNEITTAGYTVTSTYSPGHLVFPSGVAKGTSESSVSTELRAFPGKPEPDNATSSATIAVGDIEPVTVRGVTFSALKLTMTTSNTNPPDTKVLQQWYVLDVGLVKTLEPDGGTVELKTYRIGGGGGVNGVCGSSHGGTFDSAPADNLCSSGTASAVTGKGPWNWTCNGSNGGSNASCLANTLEAPVAKAATSNSSSSFSANWTAVTGAAGYRLDVATDSAFSTFIPGYQDKDVANATSYAVTGLSPNTVYYYRLRAYNVSHTSANSNTITASTSLATPVATAATSVTQGGFSAHWGAVSGATGYRLDVSTTSGFISPLPGYSNKDVGSVTAVAVTGLNPGTTYYYRVRAYNGSLATGNSNSVAVTTSYFIPVVVNGRCGSSNGGSFATAPATDLCAAGLLADFSGGGPWSWSCSGIGGGNSAACSASILTYTLSATVSGSGSVNSLPAGIACTSGTCQASYNAGTSVTLTATPDSVSTFAGWDGACTSVAGDCTVAMTASQAVTALFSAASKAKIGTSVYPSLAAAYAAADDNAQILLLDAEFAENATLNRTVAVALRGGLGTGFGTKTGQPTRLKGTLLIRSGKATVDQLVVR